MAHAGHRGATLISILKCSSWCFFFHRARELIIAPKWERPFPPSWEPRRADKSRPSKTPQSNKAACAGDRGSRCAILTCAKMSEFDLAHFVCRFSDVRIFRFDRAMEPVFCATMAITRRSGGSVVDAVARLSCPGDYWTPRRGAQSSLWNAAMVI